MLARSLGKIEHDRQRRPAKPIRKVASAARQPFDDLVGENQKI